MPYTILVTLKCIYKLLLPAFYTQYQSTIKQNSFSLSWNEPTILQHTARDNQPHESHQNTTTVKPNLTYVTAQEQILPVVEAPVRNE